MEEILHKNAVKMREKKNDQNIYKNGGKLA
jgi:hypothetical protein